MPLFYREIRPEDAKTLIKWRTSDLINSKMLTDIKHIEPADQLKWINSLYQKPFGYSLIVCYDDKDIGYVSFSLNAPEYTNGTVGFYIYDMDYRSVASLVLIHAYNLVMSIPRTKRLYFVVKDDNKNIIQIHQSLGSNLVTDAEKKQLNVEVPPGFSLYVCYNHQNEKMDIFRDVVAQYPVKLWAGRDPSITSKLFIY